MTEITNKKITSTKRRNKQKERFPIQNYFTLCLTYLADVQQIESQQGTKKDITRSYLSFETKKKSVELLRNINIFGMPVNGGQFPHTCREDLRQRR